MTSWLLWNGTAGEEATQQAPGKRGAKERGRSVLGVALGLEASVAVSAAVASGEAGEEHGDSDGTCRMQWLCSVVIVVVLCV